MRLEQEVNVFAKDAIKRRFLAAETSMSVVQGKISALISESEIIELQNSGTTMYSKLGKLDMDVSGLTQQYSEMATKYDSVTEQYTALDSKLAQYKTSVDGLSADISQVNTRLNDNYSTTEAMNAAIKAATDEISLSISKTYVTTATLSSTEDTLAKKAQGYASDAQTAAINSANANTSNILKSYSTTTAMQAAIKAATDEISLSVSESYVTTEKLSSAQKELNEQAQSYANAAQTAANTNTENALKAYSTTLQMNSAITARSDEILSSVSKTYVTGERVTSMIDQKADSIRLKANQIAWDSEKSSMTADGKLTCTEADIMGSISAGGKDNKNGEVKVYDENNNLKVILDKDGIRHYNNQKSVPYHYRSLHVEETLYGELFSGGGTSVCKLTREISLSSADLPDWEAYAGNVDNMNVSVSFKEIGAPGKLSSKIMYVLGTAGISYQLYAKAHCPAVAITVECSYVACTFNNLSARYVPPDHVTLNIDLVY